MGKIISLILICFCVVTGCFIALLRPDNANAFAAVMVPLGALLGAHMLAIWGGNKIKKENEYIEIEEPELEEKEPVIGFETEGKKVGRQWKPSIPD